MASIMKTSLSKSRMLYRCIASPLTIGPLTPFGSAYKHTLPDLPYDYNELEPTISAEIMKIHHQKHHATYVNNLNDAEEKTKEAFAKGDLATAIRLESAIKFNGGGHINHSIFWTNLIGAGKGGEASADLKTEVDKAFGSFEAMKTMLSNQAVAIQGSGWAWLGYCRQTKRLLIKTCPNQDPVEGMIPLLGIDVWEHAYYLQYKNVRADYVKSIWNVVNWKNINDRLIKAKQG